MLDQAKAAALVETARQQWSEHHRLAPICTAAFDEAHRLERAMMDALRAARAAEGELSTLLQCAALEEHASPAPAADGGT